MILAARILAALVAVPTFALLIIADRWSLGHLFFVPDLILCAALLGGAVASRRHARRVLALAFVFAAGVITTAVFSYVARSALEEGVPTLIAAITCLATGLVLTFAPPSPGERVAESARSRPRSSSNASAPTRSVNPVD